MSDCGNNCDRQCKDHVDSANRIKILESKYDVVQANTNTVSKLSARVSLLIVFMTVVIFLVSGGAIYTYTGVNGFEEKYFDDRIELNKEMTQMNIANRELIIESIDKLEYSIDGKIDRITDRVTTMNNDVIRLQSKIEDFHVTMESIQANNNNNNDDGNE